MDVRTLGSQRIYVEYMIYEIGTKIYAVMYEVYVTIMSTETTESEVPICYSPLRFDFRFANHCFSYSNQGSGGLVRSVDKPASRTRV